MPALQVRDCPDDVYEQLRDCAAQDNRSMAQQTLVILKEYLNRRNARAQAWVPAQPQRVSLYVDRPEDAGYLEKRRKAFERISGLPPIPVAKGAPDTVELLARIREEEAR